MAESPIDGVRQRLAAGRVRLVDPRGVQVTVETTATQLLGPNPNRVQWVATNQSNNDGRIGYTPDVSTSRGILLGQGGGSVSSRFENDGATVFMPVFGVLATASGTVTVHEWEVY